MPVRTPGAATGSHARIFRQFAQDNFQSDLFTGPEHHHFRGLAYRRAPNPVGQFTGPGDFLAVKTNDDVFVLDAPCLGRAALHNPGYQRTLGTVQTKPFGQVFRQLQYFHPKPTPGHAAVFLKLGDHAHGDVDGNRKAHTHKTA